MKRLRTGARPRTFAAVLGLLGAMFGYPSPAGATVTYGGYVNYMTAGGWDATQVNVTLTYLNAVNSCVINSNAAYDSGHQIESGLVGCNGVSLENSCGNGTKEIFLETYTSGVYTCYRGNTVGLGTTYTVNAYRNSGTNTYVAYAPGTGSHSVTMSGPETSAWAGMETFASGTACNQTGWSAKTVFTSWQRRSWLYQGWALVGAGDVYSTPACATSTALSNGNFTVTSS
jgi:hypothetical protein